MTMRLRLRRRCARRRCCTCCIAAMAEVEDFKEIGGPSSPTLSSHSLLQPPPNVQQRRLLRAIVAALRSCPSCCCLQYCRCVSPRGGAKMVRSFSALPPLQPWGPRSLGWYDSGPRPAPSPLQTPETPIIYTYSTEKVYVLVRSYEYPGVVFFPWSIVNTVSVSSRRSAAAAG